MQSVNAVSSLFWKPRTSPARLKHRARGNAAASKKARQTGSKGKRKKKTRRQANGVRDKCRTPRARKKVKAEAVTQAQNKKAYTELMPNGFGNPSSAIVEDASVFAVTLLRVSEVLVVTICHDSAARIRSYELIADVFRLGASADDAQPAASVPTC